jgi:hypothetical protein
VPRLTNKQFLEEHHRLALAYESEPLIFGSVTPAEQWALHDFFVPTKDLSNDELLAHRKAITKQQSSLPNRAGKAYAFLASEYQRLLALVDQLEAEPAVMSVVPAGPLHRQIWVRGALQLEVDAGKIAQVIISLAREQQKGETA